MDKRPEKNSERVEVRLPYSLKQRFLSACAKAGDTPSEALRDAMSDYIARIEQAGKRNAFQEFMMKLIHNPLKAAGMALTSTAAFALLAAPSSADERLFKALDSNQDGQLTATDAAPLGKVIFILDADCSGSISLDEFQTEARYAEFGATMSNQLQIAATRIFVHEDDTVIFRGNIDVRVNDGTQSPDFTPHFADLDIASIDGTLVKIDFTHIGEVRFTTETKPWTEIRDDPDVQHLVVEMEGANDSLRKQALSEAGDLP